MEGQLYDSNGDDGSCCRMNNNEVDENKERNMKIWFGEIRKILETNYNVEI